MMRRAPHYIVPILFLCSVYRVCGQDIPKEEDHPIPLLFGPAFQTSFSADDAAVPVYYGSTDCGIFSKGRTFTAALGGTIVVPSFLTSRIGLTGSLRLSFSSGRLTASPIDPIRIVDNETGELVSIDEEYRLNTTSWIAECDLLLRANLSDRIAVAFGPSIGYRLSSHFTQTENILAPADFRLANGHKEQEMFGGSQPNSSGLAVGPVLSATYAFPLGEGRILVPGITARADLLSSIKDFSWRSYSAGLSLALLFDLTPIPPELPSPVDTTPVIPPTPALTASIDMFGVDVHNNPLPTARIQVFETFFQRYAPIIPAAFFEHDKADLPDRYVSLDSTEIDSFSPDNLAKSDLITIQHQLLNLIGSRLRQMNSGTITMVGFTSNDEQPELARSRAEGVKSYLTQVWRIDPSRIRIKQGVGTMPRSNEETEDGRGDNRRVEISGDNIFILSPVVTTELVRDFNPPLIKMRPEFEAEAGVKEWSLVISQGGNQVARYGSRQEDSDTSTNANTDMMWRIVHDRVDSALSPLIALLTVEDSTGAVVTAESTLPLTMIRTPRVVDQRVEQRGDRERLAWTLVGFDFSSAELGTQNRAAVEGIAETIREGAHVTITGYTDRIGNQEHNKELATARAANVAELLRQLLKEKGVNEVIVDVAGAGIETERFNNDLPEGRFLSRGVGVVLEQKTDSHP